MARSIVEIGVFVGRDASSVGAGVSVIGWVGRMNSVGVDASVVCPAEHTDRKRRIKRIKRVILLRVRMSAILP